jgi:hypothetical protein
MYTMKNMTIQQFQLCQESQLIEVMNMKMHWIHFALIVNLIQMKLMKVIDIAKNMTIQHFQHCQESHLIEAMKMKMHWIQFVSIANLIQMKVIHTRKNMTTREFQDF